MAQTDDSTTAEEPSREDKLVIVADYSQALEDSVPLGAVMARVEFTEGPEGRRSLGLAMAAVAAKITGEKEAPPAEVLSAKAERFVLAAQDVARDETTGLPTLILTRVGERPQRFVMTPKAARAAAQLLVVAADAHDAEMDAREVKP